jgi:hypothetical protein
MEFIEVEKENINKALDELETEFNQNQESQVE